VIIDCHGHTVAPPELYEYQSLLLASQGAHGKGRPDIDDEKLKTAVWKHGGKVLTHDDAPSESGTHRPLVHASHQ